MHNMNMQNYINPPWMANARIALAAQCRFYYPYPAIRTIIKYMYTIDKDRLIDNIMLCRTWINIWSISNIIGLEKHGSCISNKNIVLLFVSEFSMCGIIWAQLVLKVRVYYRNTRVNQAAVFMPQYVKVKYALLVGATIFWKLKTANWLEINQHGLTVLLSSE